MTWAIANWAQVYETAESKRLKSMPWVRLPCDLASSGYIEMLTEHEDGEAHFGAWVAVLELAVRGSERGTLSRSNGRPHTLRSIAAVTRYSETTLSAMLERAVAMGWATHTDTPSEKLGATQQNAGSGPAKPRGREEEIRGEEKREENTDGGAALVALPKAATPAKQAPPPMEAIAAAYLEILVPPLPALRCGVPASARRNVMARWRATPDIEEWRQVFQTVKGSPFLLGNNDRGWRASFLWIVQAANWDKIRENTYSTTAGGITANDVGDAIMQNARSVIDEQRQRSADDGDGGRPQIASRSVPHLRG